MEQLNRELALRIALASRHLHGVSVSELLDVLHELIGTPIDEEKLRSVKVSRLKTEFANQDGRSVKQAVRCLWGEESEEATVPDIQLYKEGEIPNSIRVAIASNSGSNLDGHFGSCLRFLVYQLSRDEMRLIDIRSTIESSDSDDRNLFRVNLIKDCHVAFMQSVGGPAAAKIVRADIYPLKVTDVVDATEQLKEFQKVFEAPPPWFAKILGVSAEQRKRFHYDEA